MDETGLGDLLDVSIRNPMNMKILIMTDMEGVAGVLNHDDWVQQAGRFYSQGVRFLTEETNAAIRGFFSAGVKEVVVVDGHGAGGIDPEALDERALLLRGRCEQVWPWGLDKSFAGLAFVGQHAKAGTPYSHITHTQWFNFTDLRVNGISIGEYGQLVLCAMEAGVPTILACGEEALCREAEALTPGVITVSGKRGLLPDGLDHLDTESYRKAKLSAIHQSPRRVRTLIQDAAAAAIRKLVSTPGAFGYPRLVAPFERTVRFRRFATVGPYETVDTHPDSIIALMNMPIAPGPAQI
jgi:D-aminopeptidase